MVEGGIHNAKITQSTLRRSLPRDRQNPRMIVGTVEQVGGKLKIGFTDFEELREIMSVPRGRTPRRDASIQRGDEG